MVIVFLPGRWFHCWRHGSNVTLQAVAVTTTGYSPRIQKLVASSRTACRCQVPTHPTLTCRLVGFVNTQCWRHSHEHTYDRSAVTRAAHNPVVMPRPQNAVTHNSDATCESIHISLIQTTLTCTTGTERVVFVHTVERTNEWHSYNVVTYTISSASE